MRAVVCVASVAALSGAATAEMTVFENRADFAAQIQIDMSESFETLTADRALIYQEFNLPGVRVTSAGMMGVFNSPTGGHHATSGTQHIAVSGGQGAPGVIQFDLAEPTTAFGIDITDFGDRNPGQLRFWVDFGEGNTPMVVVDATPLRPDAEEIFIGFAQTTPFNRIFIESTAPADGFGFDSLTLGNTIPAPASAGLLALGGLALARRRR
ncbi:MAG: hypothetical protein ACF8SC_07065 [Phycisphaerales bacterium JB037]